jgi:hypothetical protein
VYRKKDIFYTNQNSIEFNRTLVNPNQISFLNQFNKALLNFISPLIKYQAPSTLFNLAPSLLIKLSQAPRNLNNNIFN